MIPLYILSRDHEGVRSEYSVSKVWLDEIKEGEGWKGNTKSDDLYDTYSTVVFYDYDDAEEYCRNKNKEWRFFAIKDK